MLFRLYLLALETTCDEDGYNEECTANGNYSAPMCKDGTCVSCEKYYENDEENKNKKVFSPMNLTCIDYCPDGKPSVNSVCPKCDAGTYLDTNNNVCLTSCPD